MTAIEVVEERAPGDAVLDVAVSHALLRAVAAGARPPALRVYVPPATVAFGRRDATLPGFERAVAAARAHGYAPVVRAPGGRAAAYDAGSLVVEEILHADVAPGGIQERFDAAAALVADALRGLGVDARVGAVPGEYCPGAQSVNAGGRVKLAGVAQRVIRGAALVATVVVVRGAAPLRDVLVEVYAALGVELDPATVGAVEDVAPGIGVADVREAVLAAYGERHALADGRLDAATLAAAEALRARHAVPHERPQALAGGHARHAGR